MSNPRIIGGKARGLRLKAVAGEVTRPITDRAKESLFNIIGSDIDHAVFLDLFGGSGSVGIEALSRGASLAVFIDINRSAVAAIRENLEHTRLQSQALVLHLDAFPYIRQMPDHSFDYIFIAPPQYKELWLRALQELDLKLGWLSADGWVIVQIDPVEYQDLTLINLEEFEQRRYGSTLFVFYRLKNIHV